MVDELDPSTRAWLADGRFPADAFAELIELLRRGAFPLERNHIGVPIEPPRREDLAPWPQGDEDSICRKLGSQALTEGRVALVVLNGGMATRFGGVVKGTVAVVGRDSFLALKLRAAGDLPTWIMNSFATGAATEEHLAEHRLRRPGLHQVEQSRALRLRPDGSWFRDPDGALSPYAPGHGDVFEAVASHPEFRAWTQGPGQRVVLVSNVDNLGATPDMVALGQHLRSGMEVTAEVAERWPGDQGGAPARWDGRLAIAEQFRIPPGFDLNALPVFNTNSLWVNAEVFFRPPHLNWYRVDKSVNEQVAVQFERLMGEVTSTKSTQYLIVPRSGPSNRFLPVKSPDDLPIVREWVERHGFINSQ